MRQNSALAATMTDPHAQKSVCQCPVDSSVLAMTSRAPCCLMTSHAVPHLTHRVSNLQQMNYVNSDSVADLMTIIVT